MTELPTLLPFLFVSGAIKGLKISTTYEKLPIPGTKPSLRPINVETNHALFVTLLFFFFFFNFNLRSCTNSRTASMCLRRERDRFFQEPFSAQPCCNRLLLSGSVIPSLTGHVWLVPDTCLSSCLKSPPSNCGSGSVPQGTTRNKKALLIATSPPEFEFYLYFLLL